MRTLTLHRAIGGVRRYRPVVRTAPRPRTMAWVPTARGERRSDDRLEFLRGDGVIVLNDRRAPGSDRTIKGIAVSPAGVFVIDSRPYKGLVQTKRPGPVGSLGPPELHVGRRNCTAALDDLAGQVAVVRSSIDESPLGRLVPVLGTLCLPQAAWGFASAMEVRDLWIGWPQLLPDRIRAGEIMDSAAVWEISAAIADRLPLV